MSRGSNYPAGGTPQSSQIIWFEQKVKEQEARIAVLEKALVASEQDYEKLLKEQGTTVDEAWQKYCEVMMPQKTSHIYPLAGAMYKTFVTAWNAALKEKK
jgi:hypothetical protein